jgi:flagellin-like protein
MNKKGLSPLIATLLLVIFAIALGSIVMSWGKEYVEQATAVQEVTVESIGEKSVFEELDERFQRGEITQEQYEELKQILHET